MKIGVISDTHIPERAPELPKEIYSAFKDVDLILHAGDLITWDVLESLKKIGPVRAVYGNMDTPPVKSKLKEKEIIEAGNFKIGLIHGSGSPANLISFAKGAFEQKMDVIVFGHSHNPVNEKKSGILFFNPGSPTDTVFAPYKSYGILEINDEIKSSIIKLL
ncbi:MAG: metallophosphoesterase family protein [Candidatus Omnitrophica bacterium]|nr:metallophosphoesterase family protein [Candidatus Omnitrophota bacterium]MDD5352290.1 metallophosphoesterase family protein [Candidatus Omnitrophota bacterium]MDD5549888.1 metallophosphoesterase family protein [Candidatus Omnitrophota bacterium]